jgi:biotin-dependent carboxylase-like uncharacterized protein
MDGHLHIHRHGPLMSVQDDGRYGYRARGVSTSGAIDRGSHAIANALVGNETGAAAIEFALVGGTVTANRDVRFAVTGGSCRIEIDGAAVPGWESHVLKAGQALSLGALQGSVWGYVAFSGGIAIPPVLGSRSTHLRTSLGGLDGRALLTQDILPLGEGDQHPLLTLGQPYFRRPGPILVVPGPQDDHFDESAWTTFLTRPYRVSASRDRMAMVLEGQKIEAFKGHDIVSDATVVGSIQIPGSGKPIVLTADGQTTGGYPKIATVASFDLARLAQMPSGQGFRFRAISPKAAEELFIYENDRLSTVIGSLRTK